MSKDSAFEVGDKIVHPAHGAGVIAAIEQRDVLDDYSRYYIIDLAAQDMRLMVPVRTAKEIGLRSVAGQRRSRSVLKILEEPPEELPDDFKRRQALLTERLRTGDAEALATVVRDMAHRSQRGRRTRPRRPGCTTRHARCWQVSSPSRRASRWTRCSRQSRP
jgi:CarD family transcriptional regulator